MNLFTKTILISTLILIPATTMAADSSISTATVTGSDTTPSASETMSVTFTTTGVPDSTNITLAIFSEDGTTLNSDFDLSGVLDETVLSNNTSMQLYSSNVDVNSNNPFGDFIIDAITFTLDSAVPANTYTINIPGIVNPATEGNYRIGISTASEMNLLDAGYYTMSDAFSIATPVAFDTTAITGLKVKDITKQSATLKWNASVQSQHTVVYTVGLYNKHNDKLKLYKNINNLKKEITKASGMLKAGKTYKFRVKACDVDDLESCTNWSTYKSFTMESAE